MPKVFQQRLSIAEAKRAIDNYFAYVKYHDMSPSSVVTGFTHAADKGSSAKRIMGELRQMSLVSQQEEGLLNHAQAAAVLDISARRVGELVELGKLRRFDFLGRTYVSVREIVERRASDVKSGDWCEASARG